MDTNGGTKTKAQRALINMIRATPRRTSQEKIAKEIGIAQPCVSAWCRGKTRPDAPHREALEIVFGIPASDWLTDDERADIAALRGRK